MKTGKIYIDMDGVLADFARGVRELCRMEPEPLNGETGVKQENLMWQEIRKTDHFYSRLELVPGAKEMFDRIRREYGARCEILTGIPKDGRGIVTAPQDKTDWTHRMLSKDVKVNAVRRKQKIQFCTSPEDVLIDDSEKTIREWREHGGTGILHRTPEETLKELENKGLLPAGA